MDLTWMDFDYSNRDDRESVPVPIYAHFQTLVPSILHAIAWL